MLWLSTAELYGLFLGSRFWLDLSFNKRRAVGKCERCSKTERLQSHHRFYRDNWFDTKLEDLEVLCRWCHAKEHGRPVEEEIHGGALEDKKIPEHAFVVVAAPVRPDSVKELDRLRSELKITRAQYLQWKQEMKGSRRKKPRKLSGKTRKRKPVQKRASAVTPWHYNPTHRSRWVSRGNSSN